VALACRTASATTAAAPHDEVNEALSHELDHLELEEHQRENPTRSRSSVMVGVAMAGADTFDPCKN
jgi:hypothetical protein